jgi:hypothetical protein
MKGSPFRPKEEIAMTVVVIQEIEATPEEYDQVNEKLGDTPPDGGILHSASDLGGGKMKVVDVWESQEAWEKFVQERLIPAIAEVVPDAPQATQPEILEVHDLQQA